MYVTVERQPATITRLLDLIEIVVGVVKFDFLHVPQGQASGGA